jgi:hypothetical protein
MLAQPFSFGVLRGETAKRVDNSSYTMNYHGLELHKHVDLGNNPFMYNCDDVFRLSTTHDLRKLRDAKLTYMYSVQLKGTDMPANSVLHRHPLTTISRTTSTRIRFVTGPGASHKPGEGNFPHPAIYLGLNRLWPLAVARKCSLSGDALSVEEKKWYVDKYNEVLCLDEHKNTTRQMNTSEKSTFITPESSDYDGESCSAGQDNLGQILSAILSFRKLREALGQRYRGGLLLIDELDATFHARAQQNILKLLCEEAKQSGLQIVATTHSLYLLENALQSDLKGSTTVLYLSNRDGAIACNEFNTFKDICDHLKVQTTPAPITKPRKVTVICEDEECERMLAALCGNKLRNYMSCRNTKSIGAGQLENVHNMSRSVPELQDIVLLADGDMSIRWKKHARRNLTCLPGNQRPETLIYRHLFHMTDSDPFWRKCAPTYTRQVAMTAPGCHSIQYGDDKERVKRWYQAQSMYWGRGQKLAFESWKQANKAECLAFCQMFVKLIRGKYRGEIPKRVIDRIHAQYK